VVFKLSEDGKQIAATCSAQECSLMRLFRQAAPGEQNRRVLVRDETVTVPTTDPMSFSVKP
jgi:hypothetical protein